MANITNYVKFLYGTPQAYKNLQVKNADTLYFISEADSKQGTLYWGEKLIAGAVSNLQDLENVILENVSNNSLLVYDEAQSAWISKSVYDVIDIMSGADASNMGTSGLVPAPGVGEQNYFLRGDGVWAMPEIPVSLNGDEKAIVVENDIVSLKDFGKKFYRYVAASGDIAAHYVEQDVNADYPWAAGLEPKVVSREGELVLGWFEPNPTTIDGVNSQVSTLQTSIANIEEIIGNPAEGDKPATGLYAKADADKVYTKEETEEKIAEAVVAAAHLKRKTFETLEEADAFAKSEAHPEEYIFMVKASEENSNDKYDEYLFVDGSLEKVGSWEVDLTGYATKDEVAKKVDKQEGYELISSADVAKLVTIEEGAEVNVISSVDEIEFNVIDKHLSINSIDVSKIKNLSSSSAVSELNAKLGALTQKVEVNTGNIAANTSGLNILTGRVESIEKRLNDYVTIASYEAEMAQIKDAIQWHEV